MHASEELRWARRGVGGACRAELPRCRTNHVCRARQDPLAAPLSPVPCWGGITALYAPRRSGRTGCRCCRGPATWGGPRRTTRSRWRPPSWWRRGPSWWWCSGSVPGPAGASGVLDRIATAGDLSRSHLADAHGGDVQLDAREGGGHGSHFCRTVRGVILLPRQRACACHHTRGRAPLTNTLPAIPVCAAIHRARSRNRCSGAGSVSSSPMAAELSCSADVGGLRTASYAASA